MAPKRVSLSSIFLFLISAVLASMLVQSAYAYNNAAYGFSMTPSAGWTVNEGVSGTVVMFVGPVMPETGGNVNINVVVGNTTETLSEAISSEKAGYATEFTNFSLVSESNRTIGGLNCHETVFTFSLEGNDYMDKQVLFIENGQYFIITCTATPSNYGTYLPTFEQSLQTFQLTSSSFHFGFFIPLWTVLVVAAIVVAVIVVAFVLLRKRSKSERLQPMPPPPPPPPQLRALASTKEALAYFWAYSSCGSCCRSGCLVCSFSPKVFRWLLHTCVGSSWTLAMLASIVPVLCASMSLCSISSSCIVSPVLLLYAAAIT